MEHAFRLAAIEADSEPDWTACRAGWIEVAALRPVGIPSRRSRVVCARLRAFALTLYGNLA